MTRSGANAALLLTTCGGVQSCDGVMWRRIMQQFTSLGMAPDNLPEEALTQIYQASKSVSQVLHVALTLLGIISHAAQLYSCLVIDPTPHTMDCSLRRWIDDEIAMQLYRMVGVWICDLRC